MKRSSSTSRVRCCAERRSATHVPRLRPPLAPFDCGPVSNAAVAAHGIRGVLRHSGAGVRRRRRSICQPPGTVPGPRPARLRDDCTISADTPWTARSAPAPSVRTSRIQSSTSRRAGRRWSFRWHSDGVRTPASKVLAAAGNRFPGIVEGPRKAGGPRSIRRDFGLYEARRL